MKLLLIEDEEDILQALAHGLRKCGYAVDMAMDGKEGVTMAEINQYDLIVLDLNLPFMDGLDVLQQLRKRDKEIRVLILSARWAVDDKVQGLDLGANDYMVKPFHFAELEARIRALLRRQFSQENTILCYNSLCFDTKTRTATIQDQILELTAKETAILEYLMLNQNRVISAEELIEHIWDSNADLFSNAIKVHISSLRKKISQHCPGEVIGNIRGLGYYIGGHVHD